MQSLHDRQLKELKSCNLWQCGGKEVQRTFRTLTSVVMSAWNPALAITHVGDIWLSFVLSRVKIE
jgi:hypothetical protein